MKRNLVIFTLIFSFIVSSGFVTGTKDLCPGLTNSYGSLEEALKEPEKVIKLDLAMQKLTAISPGIGKLVNLECLDLSFNRISDLPPEFANLKKLKYLDLSGTNYMSKLPAVLTKMPSLEVVNIVDHKLWKPAQYEAAVKMLPNVRVIIKSEYE